MGGMQWDMKNVGGNGKGKCGEEAGRDSGSGNSPILRRRISFESIDLSAF